MKSIYSTNVTSTGGRNGHVRSDNNLIDADVRLPKSLGGKDDEHLTPETFFAAGYAACFDNAVMHIIRLEKIKADPPVVIAKVDLMQSETGFFSLAVELIVKIPGIEYDAAVQIVNKAHHICPYSNATRGNIKVKLTVK
jgi:osmotically inducible protein OsmC